MKRLSLALALTAVLMSACVNLSAVTDYASSAGSVVADKRPAERWRDSEEKLRAMRVDGDKCTPQRTDRPPQSEFDTAFVEAARVHDALGAYFKALGELASDKVPMPTQAMDTSLAAVKKAGVSVSASDEAALTAVTALLSRALDAYRQQKVRYLMESTHEDVANVLGVLEKLASLYRSEVKGEKLQAALFLNCSIAERDLLDPFLSRRELARVNAAYDAELAAMDTYADALKKIRKDHEEIRKAFTLNREGLERAIKALADTRKELDAAHQALSKLEGV